MPKTRGDATARTLPAPSTPTNRRRPAVGPGARRRFTTSGPSAAEPHVGGAPADRARAVLARSETALPTRRMRREFRPCDHSRSAELNLNHEALEVRVRRRKAL